MTQMSKAKDQKIKDEQDRYTEELRFLEEERYLLQSGLARSRWETKSVPDSVILKSGKPVNIKGDFLDWWDHVDDRYESGDNFLISGGNRESRMVVASAMAMRVRQFLNRFPREVVGYKHDRPSVHGSTGEEMSWAYTFQFMDVDQLGSLRRERENAARFNDEEVHELTYGEVVVLPDFFFLVEVGHEWASTWTAKLIEDLLYARGDQGLPVVLSLSQSASRTEDKNGRRVYEEIASIFREWKGVGM